MWLNGHFASFDMVVAFNFLQSTIQEYGHQVAACWKSSSASQFSTAPSINPIDLFNATNSLKLSMSGAGMGRRGAQNGKCHTITQRCS